MHVARSQMATKRRQLTERSEYLAERQRLGLSEGIFSCSALIVGGSVRGTSDRGHCGDKARCAREGPSWRSQSAASPRQISAKLCFQSLAKLCFNAHLLLDDPPDRMYVQSGTRHRLRRTRHLRLCLSLLRGLLLRCGLLLRALRDRLPRGAALLDRRVDGLLRGCLRDALVRRIQLTFHGVRFRRIRVKHHVV